MDLACLDTTSAQHEQTPPWVPARVLDSKKQGENSYYLVRWSIGSGCKTDYEDSWVRLEALYQWMSLVVEFQKLRKEAASKSMENRVSNLAVIQEASENQEQTNKNGSGRKKGPVQSLTFVDKKIISIKNIPTRLYDRFQVQMIDKKTGKITTAVLTANELRNDFREDFAFFLQKQVYRPIIQV